jgi:hypothetical protein
MRLVASVLALGGYTMNVDGTGLRQITRLRRGAGEPDWGPR